MLSHPRLRELVGDTAERAVLDSHRQHAALLRTAVAGGDTELLARLLPWVYRAQRARGLSYDYLGEQLACWQQAVQQSVVAEHAAPVLALYTWLRAVHPRVVAAAEVLPEPRRTDSSTDGARATFFAGLLDGRADRCLAVGEGFTSTAEDLTTFLAHVVHPTVVDVGKLCEHGQLSTAREHRAASILTQTLSVLYTRMVVQDGRVGHALVATTSRDVKERAAWLMATFLEADGWRVTCVDVGTSAAEISAAAREVRPHLLTLPVTRPQEAEDVARTIRSVRAEMGKRSPRILIGGMGQPVAAGSLEGLGADAVAIDFQEAVLTARRLLHVAA